MPDNDITEDPNLLDQPFLLYLVEIIISRPLTDDEISQLVSTMRTLIVHNIQLPDADTEILRPYGLIAGPALARGPGDAPAKIRSVMDQTLTDFTVTGAHIRRFGQFDSYGFTLELQHQFADEPEQAGERQK